MTCEEKTLTLPNDFSCRVVINGQDITSKDDWDKVLQQLATQALVIEKMREALNYYANANYYYGCGCCFYGKDKKYVVLDKGKQAKQALAEADKILGGL